MSENQKPIKVLHVDDDDLIAQIIRITLKHANGFEWVGQLRGIANLGEEVQRLHPDVVLLDLCLPGADPFAALNELRRTSPRTKVIIFSGHSGYSLVDRAIEAGAWGYVSKNGDGRSLLAAIKRVAGGEFVISPTAQAECCGIV
jgi:DNA-binding NarL/FixJ family response regulator